MVSEEAAYLVLRQNLAHNLMDLLHLVRQYEHTVRGVCARREKFEKVRKRERERELEREREKERKKESKRERNDG